MASQGQHAQRCTQENLTGMRIASMRAGCSIASFPSMAISPAIVLNGPAMINIRSEQHMQMETPATGREKNMTEFGALGLIPTLVVIVLALWTPPHHRVLDRRRS